jgi:hypothetical protein
VLSVFWPIFLQSRPGVPTTKVSTSHHLTVEPVANASHIPLFIQVRNNIDALAFQPLNQLGGRRPAPDGLVNVRLKAQARAQDARALEIFHLLLGRAATHRLAARLDLSEAELLLHLAHDLFGTFVILEITQLKKM